MWWIEALFLTVVETRYLCFIADASKKTGSTNDSYRTIFSLQQNSYGICHHTIMHFTLGAKQCISDGCKISEKTFNWFFL